MCALVTGVQTCALPIYVVAAGIQTLNRRTLAVQHLGVFISRDAGTACDFTRQDHDSMILALSNRCDAGVGPDCRITIEAAQLSRTLAEVFIDAGLGILVVATNALSQDRTSTRLDSSH